MCPCDSIEQHLSEVSQPKLLWFDQESCTDQTKCDFNISTMICLFKFIQKLLTSEGNEVCYNG